MDVNVYIASLVQYGLNKKLVQPCDTIYVTNGLLEAMKLDSYDPAKPEAMSLEDILQGLLEDAVERGVCDDDITSRDLFDTKLMGKRYTHSHPFSVPPSGQSHATLITNVQHVAAAFTQYPLNSTFKLFQHINRNKCLHRSGEAASVDTVRLLENDFDGFLGLVTKSGYSSWMYLQNISPAGATQHQEVAVASQIWQSLHKFFFADFSQNILSKEIANLFQLTGNGRVLISEIGVVSTAVNDAQGMASLFKIKLDALNLGMIRISEVDIDHAAHGGSRLFEYPRRGKKHLRGPGSWRRSCL